MKISRTSAVSFTAAPTTRGLAELDKLCKQGEQLLHPKGSHTTFDVYHYSMYTDPEYDTGIGKYTGEESINFIKTMKPYLGFDTEKVYPVGRFVFDYAYKNRFQCPYFRGSTTIGEDNIDLKQLTQPAYACILSNSDIKGLVKSNLETREAVDRLNNENEVGNTIDYPVNKVLYKAYRNFQALDETAPLRIEYEEYKKRPIVENYDRLALYPYLGQKEPFFFMNFDKNKKNQARFEEYKEQYKDEIEFFKFRQFIAFKQMKEAKERYNELGVEVMGDLPIGHSEEEYWAYKDAFHQDRSIGYGFAMLKYDDMKDETTPAYKLFKQEVQMIAELFDSVRLDVGTSYVKYNNFKVKGYELDYTRPYTYNNHNKVTDIIEQTFKEVKGKDFDRRKIAYEADGAPFPINWTKNGPIINKDFRNKNLIYSTQYEKPKNGADYGYGSYDFFVNTAKLNPDYLTLGTETHDGCSLRKISEEKENELFVNCRENSIPVLSQMLNLGEEILKKPKNWVKAKFAELHLAPRRFLLFTDVMGENIDIDNCMTTESKDTRYRYRLTSDFEQKYNKALQNNDGYNRPEAIAIAMHARGLDKTNPVLVEKLACVGNYLREKGVTTSKQADAKAYCTGKDELMERLDKIG